MLVVAGGRQVGKTTRMLEWLKDHLTEYSFIHYVFYQSGSVETVEKLLKEHFPNTVINVKMSRISFCLPDNSDGEGLLVLENVKARDKNHLKRTIDMLRSIEKGTSLKVAVSFLLTDPELVEGIEEIEWLSTPPKSPSGVK